MQDKKIRSIQGQRFIDLDEKYNAPNYHPLDVVLTNGRAEWLWDIDGNKYLDMLSAYSSVSHGHCHPHMLETLIQQAKKLTITSRAYHNDQMGLWSQKLCNLAAMDRVLAMNTGTEAVETALKIARKWGYVKKGIAPEMAQIIVCDHNFHGRTSTIVGFSSEAQYKDKFGPYVKNAFISIPFGDEQALRNAITPNTAGFLFEPIQGEAGIIVPPEGYLSKIHSICKKNNVLCIADEIQTGLGRTGKLFAHQYEDCKPDILILGKALGGSFYPISAVLSSNDVMNVLNPGDHGSTFGGNALACALSQTALDILIDEKFAERAYKLGEKFRSSLKNLPKHIVKEVRGKGLLNAIELQPLAGSGRFYIETLVNNGLLSKETHGQTIRFAPPLNIEESSLDIAIEILNKVFSKTQAEWEK